MIDRDDAVWRNALGVAAVVVLLPVAILVKLIAMPFERPLQRSASEVAKFLREFIDGTGGDWDWDDFASIRIADPALELIRKKAIKVDHLGTEEATQTLEQLYSEASQLARAQ